MFDPSVVFPETVTDAKGVDRIVPGADPGYVPAPTGLTDRQIANAARRSEHPATSTPIVPTEHPHRESAL